MKNAILILALLGTFGAAHADIKGVACEKKLDTTLEKTAQAKSRDQIATVYGSSKDKEESKGDSKGFKDADQSG